MIPIFLNKNFHEFCRRWRFTNRDERLNSYCCYFIVAFWCFTNMRNFLIRKNICLPQRERSNEISCPHAGARKMLAKKTIVVILQFINMYYFHIHFTFLLVCTLKCNSVLNSGFEWNIRGKILSHSLFYRCTWNSMNCYEFHFFLSSFILSVKMQNKTHRKKQIIYWRDYAIPVAWITVGIVARLEKQWECLTFQPKKCILAQYACEIVTPAKWCSK